MSLSLDADKGDAETRRPFSFAGARMATPDIDNAAAQPAKVQTPAATVEQHDLADQIAYDRYSRAKAARAATMGGVIFGKICPAAAIPDQQGTGINESDSLGSF